MNQSVIFYNRKRKNVLGNGVSGKTYSILSFKISHEVFIASDRKSPSALRTKQ
jgi:hypothetical protein